MNVFNQMETCVSTHFVYTAKELDIMWKNKENEAGPFDIIGDIHGCYVELCSLLNELGYIVDERGGIAIPTEDRKTVFLGDLCDRGPKNIEVLSLVMNMVLAGTAYCVTGNHDAKLSRSLRGYNVLLTHGLDKTIEQLRAQKEEFIMEVNAFLEKLVCYYIFDKGRLVVAHAGLKEEYLGCDNKSVKSFCLYGDTTGEIDEYGLPIRKPWAKEYRGKALVVYGHTPTPEVEIINNTFCIDTGCVFGGRLTALRYPEKEIIQVNAKKKYYTPTKPFFDY